MNINDIIKNTEAYLNQTVVEHPTYNPRAIVDLTCELLQEVYPNGHMFQFEQSAGTSGLIYEEYPEYLNVEMAWGRAIGRFDGLKYPIIRTIQQFLSDMRLKALMGSHKELTNAELSAGMVFPVEVNVLEAAKNAIVEKIVSGNILPLEFSWMNRDYSCDHKLIVGVDLNHRRITSVTHCAKFNSDGCGWVSNTIFDVANIGIAPLDDRDVRNKLNTALNVVDDIRTRVISSKNPLNDYCYFKRELINAQCLNLKYISDRFIPTYPSEPKGGTFAQGWKYSIDRPRPGKFYHKWSKNNWTHVGLCTNKTTADNELYILWFSLLYEDKEHSLYLSAENDRAILREIPLGELCDRKGKHGYFIRKESWAKFRKIIDQLTTQ